MTPSSASQPASKTMIWLGMLSIYIVWGSTYLAIRFAVDSIPPFLMAGVRFLLAGGALLVWRLPAGDRKPTLRHWRSAGIIGLMMLLGGNGGVVWAEQRVPSGIAALLVGSTPLWIVLIEAVVYRKRPSWPVLAGVIVGLGGMAVLIGPSQLTGLHGDIDLVGGIVVALAALSWAGGSLYSRGADLPDSPFLYNGMEMVCGGAALMILSTLSGEWGRLNVAAISLNSWLGFGYLVLFGSLVGFSAYTWLLRSAPTMLVSTYAYVNPVVAVLIGNLLAQEPLTPRVLLAATVIIGAVVLITYTKRDKKGSTVVPLEEP